MSCAISSSLAPPCRIAFGEALPAPGADAPARRQARRPQAPSRHPTRSGPPPSRVSSVIVPVGQFELPDRNCGSSGRRRSPDPPPGSSLRRAATARRGARFRGDHRMSRRISISALAIGSKNRRPGKARHLVAHGADLPRLVGERSASGSRAELAKGMLRQILQQHLGKLGPAAAERHRRSSTSADRGSGGTARTVAAVDRALVQAEGRGAGGDAVVVGRAEGELHLARRLTPRPPTAVERHPSGPDRQHRKCPSCAPSAR